MEENDVEENKIWGYPRCPICGDPTDYCPGHGEEYEATIATRKMREVLGPWFIGSGQELSQIVEELFQIAQMEEI